MDLQKSIWTEKDIEEFNTYLYSLRRVKKIEWTKNIVNTNMEVLALETKTMDDIARKIKKGNYLSFLACNNYPYYENTIIASRLISSIKDFDQFKKELDTYLKYCDNWSSIDTLKFRVNRDNEEKLFNLAKKYIKSKKPFVRRTGIRIFFQYIESERLPEVFNLIDTMKEEKHYYVNMCIAWFVCECFIKNTALTKEYLNNHNLNTFCINKAISKCNDSYRISKDDKKYLQKYKVTATKENAVSTQTQNIVLSSETNEEWREKLTKRIGKSITIKPISVKTQLKRSWHGVVESVAKDGFCIRVFDGVSSYCRWVSYDDILSEKVKVSFH